MTITIGTFNFGTHLHGTPVVPPWEFSVGTQRFAGVIGEQLLFGSLHGRIVEIDFELYGFATQQLLQVAVALMAAAIGTSGTLTVTLSGSDITTLTLCVFYGFQPAEAPWLDGSGVNGWQQRGTLIFRQVAS